VNTDVVVLLTPGNVAGAAVVVVVTFAVTVVCVVCFIVVVAETVETVGVNEDIVVAGLIVRMSPPDSWPDSPPPDSPSDSLTPDPTGDAVEVALLLLSTASDIASILINTSTSTGRSAARVRAPIMLRRGTQVGTHGRARGGGGGGGEARKFQPGPEGGPKIMVPASQPGHKLRVASHLPPLDAAGGGVFVMAEGAGRLWCTSGTRGPETSTNAPVHCLEQGHTRNAGKCLMYWKGCGSVSVWCARGSVDQRGCINAIQA